MQEKRKPCCAAILVVYKGKRSVHRENSKGAELLNKIVLADGWALNMQASFNW